METLELQWFEAPGAGPKWVRRAAIDADGIIYIPAVAVGGEMEVFLCAGYDGTRVVFDGKHGYYPSHWLKREFPKSKELIEKVERRIKEHLDA